MFKARQQDAYTTNGEGKRVQLCNFDAPFSRATASSLLSITEIRDIWCR